MRITVGENVFVFHFINISIWVGFVLGAFCCYNTFESFYGELVWAFLVCVCVSFFLWCVLVYLQSVCYEIRLGWMFYVYHGRMLVYDAIFGGGLYGYVRAIYIYEGIFFGFILLEYKWWIENVCVCVCVSQSVKPRQTRNEIYIYTLSTDLPTPFPVKTS